MIAQKARLTKQLPVRLTAEQRERLEAIASRNYQKPSNLVRMAVDQLLARAEANGGQLPFAPEAERDEEGGSSHLVKTEMGLQARQNVSEEAAADREHEQPEGLEGDEESNRGKKKGGES